MTSTRRPAIDSVALWIAQGFGVGRIPFAPGTFGSLLGFGWFFLLLVFRNPFIYALGSILGVAVSVWSAGRGEKILGQTDPGSVVIDEIIAIPFCFIGFFVNRDHQPFYSSAYWRNHMASLLIIFVAFRLFDIWKPWPIRRSQNLPGGWGITIDDLLAAAYMNLIWLLPFFPL